MVRNAETIQNVAIIFAMVEFAYLEATAEVIAKDHNWVKNIA